MSVLVSDPDLTIYLGDALDVLRGLSDGSVDCCVTSPPYWGLRDYGTGSWDGGDADCDHKQGRDGAGRADGIVDDRSQRNSDGAAAVTRQVCKCGARRVDQQLGLEATPDQYVANMVAVFREVRRVLADHGTLWLNLGDSYADSGPSGASYQSETTKRRAEGNGQDGAFRVSPRLAERGLTYRDKKPHEIPTGLKPKDLAGIPWRVAFALQADGWYLRADIIWAKPNPMPESVTDRPTKAHEYVFLLSKRPRYWFDQDAVREPHTRDWASETVGPGYMTAAQGRNDGGKRQGNGQHPAGRNVRSVWEIPTQPYPDAHFATFPEELPRRCILAGCPEWVCGTCGKARERLVERTPAAVLAPRSEYGHGAGRNDGGRSQLVGASAETLGWSDCGHANFRPGRVLDPFLGSGTTALVARNHCRSCVGIELNPVYAALAAHRLQQLSLLAVPA